MNLRALLLTAAALLLGGCLERTDAPPRVSAQRAAEAGQWELAGEIGGTAEVTQADDPFERRAERGKFLFLSGIDATNDAVWATDLWVSRVQSFGLDGELRQVVGSGVVIDDATLASDERLLEDSFRARRSEDNWEFTAEARRWIGQQGTMFKAADVAVGEHELLLADWTRTSAQTGAARDATLLRFDLNGRFVQAHPSIDGQAHWPSYVAMDGVSQAFSDPLVNSAWVMRAVDGQPLMSAIGASIAGRASRALELLYARGKDPRWPAVMLTEMGASDEPGKLYDPQGIDIAFGKLILCDTGNRRIQVFDAAADEQFYLGKPVRIIHGRAANRDLRFVEPRAVSVSDEGRIYVLDTARMEVVELSPTFDRLGVVADGLGDPYDIAVSPDGRHLFVAERSGNRILHYARTD